MTEVSVALTLLYMLPGIVALLRWHRNWVPIAVLTMLTGWTGIGWIVALVWSLTNQRRPA